MFDIDYSHFMWTYFLLMVIILSFLSIIMLSAVFATCKNTAWLWKFLKIGQIHQMNYVQCPSCWYIYIHWDIPFVYLKRTLQLINIPNNIKVPYVSIVDKVCIIFFQLAAFKFWILVRMIRHPLMKTTTIFSIKSQRGIWYFTALLASVFYQVHRLNSDMLEPWVA